MDKEPTFIPPQESERRHSNFSRAADSLRRMSARDIGFLDIVSDLETLKEGADAASEEEKDKARIPLKKILTVLPPWRRGASFVSQNLESLAYTPGEQESLALLREQAKTRQTEIEAEVAEGVSPWLARVSHNEQNPLNPVAVGFYQMPDGQIKTIFGSRYFQSKRQIKTEGLFFGGRSEDKEVNLLSTRFQNVDRPEIMRTPLFDLLPEDLRTRLERGEILVTGEQDIYDLNETEIENLATNTDVNATTRHIENKIADAGKEKRYYLLYQSDYHSDETGRTGVLMVVGNGKAQPVIITVGNKQFVLEIKGCGKKGGGFGKMHHRTGRDIITGGAEREQAVNEFERLSEMTDEDSPKAVASILFDNQGYQQGYILRLTPSTIRASYAGNEVYPAIDSPEQISKILNVYTQELAEQVFAQNPKILDRSSHTENILLWGDGRHTFTDFSDHVTFSDVHYPHDESHGGYMRPRQMLEYYVKMVEEIPGYNAERDKKAFLKSLERAFAAKGHDVSLNETEEYSDIAKRLWEGGMAYQVFSARGSNNYRAVGVVEEFRKSVGDTYHQRELSLTSKQDFIDKYEAGFQKMLAALDVLRGVEGDDVSEMERVRGVVETRNLPELLKNLDRIYNAWREQKNLTENERDNIYGAISYFSGLDYTLIRVVKRYLDHEHDVIFSAENSAPSDNREAIEKAKKEIEGKQRELEATLSNPQDLYERLTNMDWVQNFLVLNCYQK